MSKIFYDLILAGAIDDFYNFLKTFVFVYTLKLGDRRLSQLQNLSFFIFRDFRQCIQFRQFEIYKH